MVSEKAGPEAIDEAIRLAEAKHAQKTTFRVTKRVLGPVVNVLKDYYTVIESCCKLVPFCHCGLAKIFEVRQIRHLLR